jgi:RNA binding exosome subunit
MKKSCILFLVLFFSAPGSTHGGILDNLINDYSGKSSTEKGLNNETIVSGLKEALSLSTEKAVRSVSKEDGFYKNPKIKISVPKKLQTVASLMKKFGFEESINHFELSMNRAVEKAAPKATSIFVKTIKQMSFEDAGKILKGGDTAATEYFSQKTTEDLYALFKPVVTESMSKVGVAQSYKNMKDKYTSLAPFAKSDSLDLDDYVTRKGLDGLFFMMAEEEKKIRNNPVERTTELLKTVFGR